MKTFRCAACGSMSPVATVAAGKPPACPHCKQALDLSGTPQSVDAAGLRKAIEASPVPVVVEFSTQKSDPVRHSAFMFTEVGRAHAGQALLLQLNLDDDGDAVGRYNIRARPTFVVFASGAERARQLGLPLPEDFTKWLDRQLEPIKQAEAAHG